MAVLTGYANERTDVLLSDGWTIRPISDPTPGKEGTAVTLPHTWNASYVKGTYYNRETMVYSRTLNVSESMFRNNRLFLRFEGVNSVADVFVNRKTVGQHKGGYTAFCMEITDYVREGDNDLEVWVSNAFRTDVLPISGDFNVYGGIHRPVHLLMTAKDCISPTDYASQGVYVHQENVSRQEAELRIETVLSLTTGTEAKQLRLTMTDASGKAVAQRTDAVSGGVMWQSLLLKAPTLWQGRKNPYLLSYKGGATRRRRGN